MFETLPHTFREFGLQADVRTLLLLQKAMQRGLVKTIGDCYVVLKGIVVKDPKFLGPFTKAFYHYFLGIGINSGETLNDAIQRSEAFKKWRTDENNIFEDDIPQEELVNLFLESVHLTHYDIKQVIYGTELWDKDRGDLEDNDDLENQDAEAEKRLLDKMADYSNLTLEELMERMNEVLRQQKTKHSGGSHWVGTGGISPYGHGGAAKNGIRVGGSGGGKMARKVLNSRKFFPVDLDATLNDNNIDAALASLKGIIEETPYQKLDIPNTINNGLKRGGLFLPELKSEMDNKLQVLLFIDNGGYSMDPYVRAVQMLFKKMKTRFAHDLETYYFHNTVYDRVFTDAYRSKPIFIDKILKKNPSYRVFFIGDAAMAPYELNRMSINFYQNITKHFKKTAWLNPEPKHYWDYTFSTQVIKGLIEMYPLSPKGIETAVREMNRKKNN